MWGEHFKVFACMYVDNVMRILTILYIIERIFACIRQDCMVSRYLPLTCFKICSSLQRTGVKKDT